VNYLIKILLISLLFGPLRTFALAQVAELPPDSFVENALFNSEGPDLKKIQDLRAEIHNRRRELRHAIENDSRHRLGHNYWDSKDLSLTSYPIPFYNRVLKDLKDLNALKNKKSQYRLAHKILLINQGVKVVGDNGVEFKAPVDLWNEMTKFELPRNKDKESGKVLDLSSLGLSPFEGAGRYTPLPRPQNLEIKDIKTNTQEVIFELKTEEGQDPLNLRVGPGIYSEATSLALLRKMGINSYPAQVYKNVTTHIKDMSKEDFERHYALIHGEDGPELNHLIKKIEKTESGLKIIWHHALLVRQDKTEDFVGIWSPFENDLSSSSFVQSMPLFYIWIGQQVFSKYRGRHLYLKQNSELPLDFKLTFYHSSLDQAFGTSRPETPGEFPWKMVDTKNSDEVVFNHRIKGLSKYPIDLNETKSMAQKILALTREDIEQAVEIGGWPVAIQELLVEKLISRRNDLIQIYDWNTSKRKLGVSKNLTTQDSRVVEGELVDGIYIQDQQDFEGGILKKLTPYLQGLGALFYKGGREILSSFNGLDIAPIELGIDNGLIQRVLFGYNRSIERNEKPTGPDDQYLVKDTFKIGFRMGGGIVVSGDVSYVKEYTLIYPVKSRADGELQNSFILNLLLPYQVHADKLPEKHVLVLSDSIEGRGRIKIGNTMTVIGQSMSLSEINLGRTYISQKSEEKAFVFSDASLFSELAYMISLELGPLGIPVFNHRLRQGSLKRQYYELDLKNQTHKNALRKIKLFNFTNRLERIAHVHKIDDTFYESNTRGNFLGFFQSSARTRYDDITESHQNDPSPDITTLIRRLQMEHFKKTSWSFFSLDEEFKSQVLLRASTKNLDSTQGQNFEGIERPHIEIQLLIDDLTTETSEFEQYIKMINKIALDPNFIQFTPSLHSRNHQWGELNVAVKMDLSQAGLSKLIQAKERDYWNALSKITQRPVSYWARALKTNLRNRRHLDVRTRDTYLANQLNSLARHLRNVGRERDDFWRMRSLHAAFTKAIYTSNQAYRPTLLAVIHEIVGSENIFLEGIISAAPDQEGHLPGKKPLYNKLGTPKDQGHPFYQFYFEQASDVYNAF
jgi:hypothetical protein